MSLSILAALDDPRLFGGVLRDKATWAAWRAFLAALFGLGMSDDEAAVYRACTGRAALPEAAFSEAWLICGRRAGKSFALALIAVYLATFRDYTKYLNAGERAVIVVIAADRKQARVTMRYVRGLLEIPALAELVEGETAEAVELTNRVTIEVGTASHGIRGRTIAAALCDELAFWPQESSVTPDVEILAALRPAMSTIPNAMLLCASSPYARKGAMWAAFKRYFGVDSPSVLVWKAATRTMNETVPQRVIDEAVERDPSSAAAEYGADFRTDVASFVSIEAVEACVDLGERERPPHPMIDYSGFIDPSGGSSDSFAAGVAHRDGDEIILDAIREVRPPFSPESVTKEMADFFKSYRISRVVGDRFGGLFPREQLAKYGVHYEAAARPKSDLYGELLPLINSRRVRLLDNPRLISQLCGLERRTARGGKDRFDHGPGAHDDVANCVAGVISMLATDEEPAIIAFYRRLKIDDEAAYQTPCAGITPDELGSLVKLAFPPDISCAFGLLGDKYTPDSFGCVRVKPDDVAPLVRAGFKVSANLTEVE